MAETATTADRPMPPQLLVIADDFTGANDTGVALIRQGLAASVQFDEHRGVQGSREGHAVIYSTDSRALSAAEAAGRETRVPRAFISRCRTT